MKRLTLLIAIAGALTLPVTTAHAQESAFRFEIQSAGDSTFTFNIGDHLWIHAGLSGIAVDPRRRDVLVARFTIQKVVAGVATSLITGQTTKLSTTDVALIEKPKAPWYQNTFFWVGAAGGFVLGLVIGH